MYTGMLHLHNLLRYAVVILLVIAVIKGFLGWFGKKEYTKTDNKISLFLLISAHTQLLIGLILYFISPIVQTGLSDFGAAMRCSPFLDGGTFPFNAHCNRNHHFGQKNEQKR